jgi:outer membrane protein assembly factor BamA
MRLFVCVFGVFAFCACSLTKRVPDGQFLLYKEKINLENKDKRINKDDILLLIRQHPNKGFQAFGICFYNFAKPGDSNWINRVVRNIGSAPIIYDSTLDPQSIYQISRYLFSKGHFSPEVSIDTSIVSKKRIQLTYNVKTNDFYSYQNTMIDVADDSLKDILKDWKLDIKKGEAYDLNKLDAERSRIETFLHNNGYYFFDRSQITFLLDTAFGNNNLDVGLIVTKNTDTTQIGKFFIKDVNVTGLADVRPAVVDAKILLQSGDEYSFYKAQRSFENVNSFTYFRNVDFQFMRHESDSAKNLLDMNVNLTKAPAMRWGVDFEYTNTTGLQGLALSTSFVHRNIFKGCEILTINVRGGIELQFYLGKKAEKPANFNIINNWDVSTNVSIEFPRFLLPLKRDIEVRLIRPKTIIHSGFSYQHKTSYYDRTIINASIGYLWTAGRLTHQLFPVDLSIVKIFPTDNFKNILDTFSIANQRLVYQYQDHYISSTRYNLIYEYNYTSKVKHYDYAKLSVEIAGNTLDGGFALFKAKKNADGQYNIWGMPFSQYLRLEAEYRHYWTFAPYHLIAARTLVGFGYAYANSKSIPYEKGFFAGGTNYIRAWHLYRLGPGSYYDPNRPSIEQYGDIAFINNVEYRFPIYKILKGAAFVDFGNIWLAKENPEFPKGEFHFKSFYKDLAVGAGLGLRLEFDYFVIRLDAAVPLRDPSNRLGSTWIVDKLKFNNIILNFGVGYPF